MKKLYTLLFFFFIITASKAQIINIPDTNFRFHLLLADTGSITASDANNNHIRIDTNNDGQIEVSEALTVYSLDVSSANIASLAGIQSFTNLTSLRCFSNVLTSLDVTNLVNLTSLSCQDNDITALNTGVLTQLTGLYCYNNAIGSLDLSNSPGLTQLDCYDNQLTNLNLTGLTGLTLLRCQENMIATLDISGSTNLHTFYCNNNVLTNLDVTNFTNLQDLRCENNALTTLSLTGANNLYFLTCHHNQLTNLSFTGLTALNMINCSYNNLSAVDISDMNHEISLPPWVVINCSYNPNLATINTKDSCQMVTDYDFKHATTDNPGIPPAPPTTSINFMGTPNLQYFCADANEITYVQNKIDTAGYTNPSCQLSSTCEFLLATDNPATVLDFARVYPNPFSSAFSLDINPLGNETIRISVYDMTGKLIERIERYPTEMQLVHFGQKYASGLYNVVVSQGEALHTLRIIKR